MEIIQIEKAKFNNLFAKLKIELELDKFTCKDFINTTDSIKQMTIDMHRRFNYHVCLFKDALEKG